MATHKLSGQKGLVPENYIQIIKAKAPPPPLPSSKPPIAGNQLSLSGHHSRQGSQISNASSEFMAPRQFINPPSFIPAKEFQKYIDLFLREDADQDGYLSPMEVKKIFSLSNQSSDFLAHIWHLGDCGRDGRLSAGEFVIGMWLIGCKLRDQSGSYQLPSSLKGEHIDWLKKFDSEWISTNSSSAMSGIKISPDSRSVNAVSTQPNFQSLAKKPDTQQQQSEQTSPSPPSHFEMFKFSRSDQGQELQSTAVDFAKTDTGKAVAGAAWENKDTIIKAAQSETGKKLLSSAWENRDKVSNAAVSGMKTASKFS